MSFDLKKGKEFVGESIDKSAIPAISDYISKS